VTVFASSFLFSRIPYFCGLVASLSPLTAKSQLHVTHRQLSITIRKFLTILPFILHQDWKSQFQYSSENRKLCAREYLTVRIIALEKLLYCEWISENNLVDQIKVMFGFAGQLLRVDLSEGRFASEKLDPGIMQKYLGGTCLGARIIYDEVPAGVGWSDPENRLVLAAGPLTGTKVKGSSTLSVVTKGAMTGGGTSTQANGYFSAFLKSAGYDAIIIQGRAEHLSYLYIHDGQVEIRDAGYLKGKDTWETERLVKDELGLSSANGSVICIGPAGENMVRFAGIFGDKGHAAAHNGVGAVMGSKNLKAVAVRRGKAGVQVCNPSEVASLARELFQITKTDSQYSTMYQYGTLWLFQRAAADTGRLPYKNYTTNACQLTDEQLALFSPQVLRDSFTIIRPHPCWGCQMHHCNLIRITNGPYAGQEGEEPEYEGFTSMGSQLGIYDPVVITALSNEVDRLGMDCNETGWVIGLAMECYEKGLLSMADTDGITLTFGNFNAVRTILKNIALKEGFGKVLAEGAMRAAKIIGGEAPEYAVHTMYGNTPIGHDHRAAWSYLFDICVANTGCYELHISPRAHNFGLKEAHPFSPHDTAHHVATFKWVAPFFDSLGICRLANREYPGLLAKLLEAATGWKYSLDEMENIGLRAVNLLRAFNLRHGFTVDKEAPSPRYGSAQVDGPHAGKSILPFWDEMLDIYYQDMGWDRATGRPSPETLDILGLDEVIRELWPGKTGIAR